MGVDLADEPALSATGKAADEVGEHHAGGHVVATRTAERRELVRQVPALAAGAPLVEDRIGDPATAWANGRPIIDNGPNSARSVPTLIVKSLGYRDVAIHLFHSPHNLIARVVTFRTTTQVASGPVDRPADFTNAHPCRASSAAPKTTNGIRNQSGGGTRLWNDTV